MGTVSSRFPQIPHIQDQQVKGDALNIPPSGAIKLSTFFPPPPCFADEKPFSSLLSFVHISMRTGPPAEREVA